MKKLFVTGLVTVLFTSFGCDTGTKSSPGGPGATRSSAYTSPTGTVTTTTTHSTNAPDTAKNDTFKIKAPGETTLKQGDQKEVTITVEREKDFKHDVTLKVSTSDKGITISPDMRTIKANDANTDAKFMISASKEAAVAEHVVNVIATPSEGAPTSATFKINVKGS